MAADRTARAIDDRRVSFQSGFSRQPGILGEIYLTHAARPKPAKDAIGADSRARADAHAHVSQVASVLCANAFHTGVPDGPESTEVYLFVNCGAGSRKNVFSYALKDHSGETGPYRRKTATSSPTTNRIRSSPTTSGPLYWRAFA